MHSSLSSPNHIKTTMSLSSSLFQHSLDDLIRSLRSSPPLLEPSLLSSSLSTSLRELRSSDPSTKSLAISKLTYLSSLHSLPLPSTSFFPSLELLPSPHKRLAYLFAILHFHPSTTDLLPLTTHTLHKDLHSPSNPTVALALTLLSSAQSPDLASNLAADVLPLLSSPSRPPEIRRKSTAVALSILTLAPDSVPVLFPKLVENLSSPITVSAAVNVFCELTAVDPKPYLPLAPDFYRILVESKNNWVLIKIVKIFARLAVLEPRLGKKVVDPICDLIKKSNAKSLVFECVKAVLTSLENEMAVRVAIGKVKVEFLSSEEDANLRYLGLSALGMLKPKDSWAVEESREAVIKSLSDLDANIRREALNIVMGMVFESNVVETSVLLISYALRSDTVFANEILDAILSTCGRNYYEIVQDFDWYVSILGEMARNPHCEKGEEIERQLVDIGLRVKDARPELVRVARGLLMDPALLGNHFLDRILLATAWVSGEYVEFSKNPLELLEALLQPRTNLLPSLVRAVYIQAVFKVLVFSLSSYIEKKDANDSFATSDYSAVESEDDFNTSLKLENMKPLTHESIGYMLNLVETAVGPLYECDGVEVQERARNVLGLIQMLKEIPGWETEEGFRKNSRIREIVGSVMGAFSEELGPVSDHAQQKVDVPKGLVLKENLADLSTILGDHDIVLTAPASFSLRSRHQKEVEEESEPVAESSALLAEHRKRHGLYYLPTVKEDPGSNDYPKANDPLLSGSNDEPTGDLLKLTEQSLIPRKAKPTKPRPVVVKLDDVDTPSTSLKPVKESKDDKLSGAIRNVLLGNKETIPASSSQKETSEKSSRRKSKDIPITSESSSLTKENMSEMRYEGSISRSKHRGDSKDKHRSHRGKEDNKEKEHKNSSRNGKQKHKHRQREETCLNVVPQAPIIQDFLL